MHSLQDTFRVPGNPVPPEKHVSGSQETSVQMKATVRQYQIEPTMPRLTGISDGVLGGGSLSVGI